ncbi:MAG: hypothetical protein V3T86_15745 [Planctomycetota bacterium]
MSLAGPLAAHLAILVAVFATATPAAEFEAERDKRIRLTVSDDWMPAVRSGAKHPAVLLALYFKHTDWDAMVYLDVWDLRGWALTTRAQAYRHKYLGYQHLPHREVRLEPEVHVVCHNADKSRAHTIYYRLIRGNMFAFEFYGMPAVLKKRQKELIAALDGFVADVPTLPPDNAAYKRFNKDGLLVLKHPSVKSKLVTIKRAISATVKDFEAIHGKIPGASHALPQVIVLTDFKQRKDFGAPLRNYEFEDDWQHMRVFARSLNSDTETWRVAWFHAELHDLLFALTYGHDRPRWLWGGLQRVTRSAVLCGRSVPWIDESYERGLPRETLALRDVVALEHKNGKAFWNHSFACVAFFLTGPKTYREAFRAFLKDLRETGDWRKCEETHLYTLDQDAFRSDLKSFIKKRMKPVDRKR